jgi:hypothetical protein
MAWNCCLAWTDTNLIAIGNWSDPVGDAAGCNLRGHLLVYDKQITRTWDSGARVFLELQYVFKPNSNGFGFSDPFEIYYNPNLGTDNERPELQLELHDGHDQKIPSESYSFNGAFEKPYWVAFPRNGTVRFPSTDIAWGFDGTNSVGLKILGMGSWTIPDHSTNNYYLHGFFTASNDHPSPLHYHIWQGTLNLPTVKIPARQR